MTSPVNVPTPPKKRRSSLKRQRIAVAILLAAVILLSAVFAVVYYFTSRTVFYDWDDTKYYIRVVDGVYIMEDKDGNLLPMTEDENYITVLGTIIQVDSETGDFKVVAAVSTTGTEALQFSYYNGEFDVLLYPLLERAQIQSIEVYNEKDSFAFVKNDEDTFEIKGYPGIPYNSNMFSTLVTVTGYTATYQRLDIAKAYEKNEKTGEYLYPEYDGFRTNGYAEYGLTEDPSEAVNYFVITTVDGIDHKVVLGDETPAGTGYYARYVGRDEVYVLKELEETEFNTTLSGALLCVVEDYVTPTATATFSTNNYFDISNFMLNNVAQITKEMLEDPDFEIKSLLSNIITFSYQPVQLRQGKFTATTPYTGSGEYAGYALNSFKVDDCLQNIMDMQGIRTVELLTPEESEQGAGYFAGKYGVKYCLEYTHNTARDSAENNYAVLESMYQQIWISPMTDGGTYYLYNPLYQMIIEVGYSSLEFLNWKAFDWVESEIFTANIVYLDTMECLIPGGTTAGITGLTKVTFDIDNSASLVDWDGDVSTGNLPSSEMKVWASGTSLTPAEVDLTQFKMFYQTLVYSSLGGMASCSDELAEAYRDASANAENGYKTESGQSPDLVIKMVFNTELDGSGDTVTRVFCFYNYNNSRQDFVTLNGKGDFYMLKSRVEKIIADIGLVFTPETVIKPIK